MNKIILPPNYNYIGVFLTLRCNLGCSYCLNHYDECASAEELSADAWIEGLQRISTRVDLPLSFQGGEPTLHPGFYQIVNNLYPTHTMDLLTNGTWDIREFCSKVTPEMFNRPAKYASIRFSFHERTNGYALATKVYTLQNAGYNVGIWGLDSPAEDDSNFKMQDICKWLNIDFRLKEYLDVGNGTYKYPDAITQKSSKQVWCRPSELLINPSGHIFRCHSDLYANRNFIGHILDPEVKLIEGFKECSYYGHCNPCDVKLKTNRLQESGHCSVEIKGN